MADAVTGAVQVVMALLLLGGGLWFERLRRQTGE